MMASTSEQTRLSPLEVKSPVRAVRAWALYKELMRWHCSAAQQNWQEVAEPLGLKPAQMDQAIDDLVHHGLAMLLFSSGQIFLNLLENEPTEEDGTEGGNGGD